MSERICQLDGAAGLRRDALRRAAELLVNGGLVAFPTETVYGIGACTRSAGALERLRRLKDRPSGKPFALMVPSAAAAHWYVPFAGPMARRLMRKAWPGPLTIVVEAKRPLYCPAADIFGADAVRPLFDQDNTIGLRCPDHPIAQALLERVDGPVVATSAGRGGRSAARDAREVLERLGEEVDLILDGGPVRYGVASTVVRVVGGGRGYQILRAGLLDARTVDKMAVETWLFVCTGNTCRSPMAAAIARAKLADRIGCRPEDLARAGYRVTSAGVLAADGVPASQHAISTVASCGGELRDHHASRLTVDAVRQADRIFVMAEPHRDAVLALLPSAAAKTRLLSVDEPIADPIGGSAHVYRQTAEIIERAVEQLVKEEWNEDLSGQ